MTLKKLEPMNRLFLWLALVGFFLVNVPFLYFSFLRREVYETAMGNGMALVFMGEAFLLLIFFACFIHWVGIRKPGWLFFVVMSLLGSLAFSIPFHL